jgi:hypothetical protein
MNKLLLCLLAIFVMSCTEGKKSVDSELVEDHPRLPVSEYFKNELHVSFDSLGEQLILVIPMESCDQCVTEAIALAEKNIDQPELSVLIVTGQMDSNQISEPLLEAENVLIDETSRYLNYDLPFLKPILIVQNQSVLKYVPLSNQNIHEIFELFDLTI